MLRYKSDLRTLAFIATYFVALGFAWSLSLAHASPVNVLTPRSLSLNNTLNKTPGGAK